MISSFFTDVAVVAVVLGGMIFIHELGHFLAAKAFGVRVVTFSLGFGQRLLGVKNGRLTFGSLRDYDPLRTDYRLSLLPLGGWVKMAGDDPTDVHHDDQGEFLARPRWQRFVIVVMGPMMNVLLAVGLLTGLYRFHFEKPAYEEQPVEIGAITSNSPAAQAGLKVGDIVQRFGTLQNPRWEDVEFKVLTDSGESIPLVVLRDGKTLDVSLTPKAKGPDQIGSAGWYPCVPLIIDRVSPESPAKQAGLRPGDEIVGVNGESMLFQPLIVEKLRESDGHKIDLTVRRQSKEFQVQVRPIYSEVDGEKFWRIGVTTRNTLFVVRQLPLALAIQKAVRDNFRSVLGTFDVLGKIVTRQMSTRSLSGPIGIAQASGEAYRAGLPQLLTLAAFISLQLAIINLFPIPILDGGAILLLVIEGLLRRDLSLELKERFLQVGIVFLLLLVVFVTYNDIVKTVHPS
jgi:regulator of sigma E protease